VAAKRDEPSHWNRYAAPTAFLLAVTIAVLLVRSALQHEPPSAAPTSSTRVETRPNAPTSTSTTRAGGVRRFYTVVAGDTFGVIASKTDTSVAELERLNPDVSSTSLHIGQKIRVG
jgi:LysM repeat protein